VRACTAAVGTTFAGTSASTIHRKWGGAKQRRAMVGSERVVIRKSTARCTTCETRVPLSRAGATTATPAGRTSAHWGRRHAMDAKGTRPPPLLSAATLSAGRPAGATLATRAALRSARSVAGHNAAQRQSVRTSSRAFGLPSTRTSAARIWWPTCTGNIPQTTNGTAGSTARIGILPCTTPAPARAGVIMARRQRAAPSTAPLASRRGGAGMMRGAPQIPRPSFWGRPTFLSPFAVGERAGALAMPALATSMGRTSALL